MADPRAAALVHLDAIAHEWGWAKAEGVMADIRRLAEQEPEGRHDLTFVLHKATLSEWTVTVRRRKSA